MGLRRIFRPILGSLILGGFGLLSMPHKATAEAATPIYDQVLEIVSSDTGTVRKWQYAPKLTVIFDGDAREDEIHALVAQVNGIAGFPGIGAVEFFDRSQFTGRLAGNTQFRMPRVDFGGVEGNIVQASFRGADAAADIVLTGSIFMFLTGLEDGITFGALTQSGERLSRQFAEGTATKCYFHLLSKDDALRAGFIFVNMDDATTPVSECLYEEFMQTLGLLNDAQGSEVFTFDNTGTVRADRTPDFRLLSALYSPQVAAGDQAATVADLYMALD